MVSIDDAIIARLKTHGEKFEILVDPYKARKIKQGEVEKDFLASPFIYKDVGSAEKAQQNLLEKVFGTDNVEEIAIKIIRKGEVHLTAEQRKEILLEKKKKIVSHISRYAVDPKTGFPHPPKRIENAIEQANVHIDLFKPSEKQIDEILKKIRPIIPIRFETKKIAVKVLPEHTGKLYSVFQNFGTVIKEEWGKDGTLISLIELPAGLQDEFFSKLNAVTKGSVEVKILK
ncbi:MAG: ribosome assembly factor SBDS [Candidatus Methanofastidiosia archaeon]